mgnify:CR=1 FL=1
MTLAGGSTFIHRSPDGRREGCRALVEYYSLVAARRGFAEPVVLANLNLLGVWRCLYFVPCHHRVHLLLRHLVDNLDALGFLHHLKFKGERVNNQLLDDVGNYSIPQLHLLFWNSDNIYFWMPLGNLVVVCCG